MCRGRHARVRFGSFEVDANARVLRKDGLKVRLQEQPFEVLLTLLESAGEIVTREQLRQRLWPKGTFVAFDHALNTAVKKIRAALCDDAGFPRYIETIPRRGYRFLGSLDRSDPTMPVVNVESGVSTSRRASSRDFRSAIIACALGIPFLMLSGWMIFRPSAPKNVSLAILPFNNMNSGSAHEAAATVFSKLLLRQLQRTHPAKLMIGDGSTGPERVLRSGKAEQPPIDYVLEGGVRGDERHLYITVQLVRLSDQNCVWARDFERNSDNAQSEAEIAEEIVGQMQHTLASLSGDPR
jgi:DNA-binding winged helix-turn-helix (wHTH) protein/TolB-like protein